MINLVGQALIQLVEISNKCETCIYTSLQLFCLAKKKYFPLISIRILASFMRRVG